MRRESEENGDWVIENLKTNQHSTRQKSKMLSFPQGLSGLLRREQRTSAASNGLDTRFFGYEKIFVVHCDQSDN